SAASPTSSLAATSASPPATWTPSSGPGGSRSVSTRPCVGGPEMATIEKRVRNGKTTYRVRYRDPAGSQRSKVFARKADAQRFLNETESAKARGTWTDPTLGRVLFRDWL